MAAALPRLGASLPVPPDLAMCRRVAEHAEILGYEILWIADTGAGPDAFVVAAMAAMVTRTARIGTAVVPLYTRALPVHAAGAGSVAQLAPGRFILGLGVSSETIVDTWGGVPFRRPLGRMRESVGVLRRMLAGERVTFAGETDDREAVDHRVGDGRDVALAVARAPGRIDVARLVREAAPGDEGVTTPMIQPFLFDQAAIWNTFERLAPAGA